MRIYVVVKAIPWQEGYEVLRAFYSRADAIGFADSAAEFADMCDGYEFDVITVELA